MQTQIAKVPQNDIPAIPLQPHGLPPLSDRPIHPQRDEAQAADFLVGGRGLAEIADAIPVLTHVLDVPPVLIEKLAERLAAVAAGSHLYDLLVSRYGSGMDEACLDMLRRAGSLCSGAKAETPPDSLRRIQQEKAMHAILLEQALDYLGSPTPPHASADDLSTISFSTAAQMMTVPHAGFESRLSALLSTELADSAGWELLVKLTEQVGLTFMAEDFQEALKQEQQHIALIKDWICTLTLGAAR
ncbi:hypothetical protein [Chitinimonas naiadis]